MKWPSFSKSYNSHKKMWCECVVFAWWSKMLWPPWRCSAAAVFIQLPPLHPPPYSYIAQAKTVLFSMGTSTRESCHNCKQMIWHAKAQLQQLIWASIIIIVDLISTPPIHQSIQPAFWLASYALPSTAYTLHSVKKIWKHFFVCVCHCNSQLYDLFLHL